MRRTIAFSATPKVPGGKQEVRLFVMNDSQATLFQHSIESLARKGVPILRAAAEVERAVVAMLGGKMAAEEMPMGIHKLRFAFPVLTTQRIRNLPRAGCPDGRITAFIMQANVPETIINDDGVAVAMITHTFRVDFNEEQADFYNFALQKFIEVKGLSRDEAWKQTNDHIMRLLVGTEDRCAQNVFPIISSEELMKMPAATEDDVRRWSFTGRPE